MHISQYFLPETLGLTQQKGLSLLQHAEPHAIIITEHHLPFGHTPTYAQNSGWTFHTIEAPYKTDKHGQPTLGTRGGILLAIKTKSFTVAQKIHYCQDTLQAATWTLSAGEFIPHIHITGVYLSPDSKVPTADIKQLYTTLNNTFHPPTPPATPTTLVFNYTPTTDIYTLSYHLSLHDSIPFWGTRATLTG